MWGMKRAVQLTLAAVFIVGVITPPPARSQEGLVDTRVSNAVWGFSFTAPGYEVWEDHPLRGQPNFVTAGQWDEGGCALNASVFARLVITGTPPADCRTGLGGNPEPLKGDRNVVLLSVEDSPVAWTLFDRKLTGRLIQNQLYGYWVQGESCFELHVSAMACNKFGTIASRILDSVAIEPRPDVNVETVAVGALLELEPNHWRVHQVIAGEYLHNVSPPNPTRARAYYENALRLSGGDLSFNDAWAIQEGIGLSWLNQETGQSAIAPLLKAIKLARAEPAAVAELAESLYNLACAYSLAGDLENACVSATQLVEGLSGRERRRTLEDMRQDPQLRALREARCVKGLHPIRLD